jgi:teichuronic acid exporter
MQFFFCAPAIAAFYKEPILIDIVRVTSLTLLLNAFLIIPNIHFTRNINFKITTKISYIVSLSSGVIGIGMAFCGFGVWSLVFQGLIAAFLKTFLYWFYCRWKPVFMFSKQSFKDLFGFGSKLLASSLLNTIYNNIYQIIIGKFLFCSRFRSIYKSFFL